MNFKVTHYDSKFGHYHLLDDKGREWIYKLDSKAGNDDTTGFQRWPAEFADLMNNWTGDYDEQSEQLDKAAKDAINFWKITSKLTPKTQQTFKELIDEL
jgi:hypothetical protein